MAENELLAAYLINGEDELKRETVLKRLRSRLEKLGDMDFNCDVFDAQTGVSGADIVAACNTMPFASEKRLVVVRNADDLKKADSEAIVAYLGEPAPFTVLALAARKLAKNTRLYKAAAAVGKKAVIDCAPMKRYELPRTVRSMAVGRGFAMTEDAASRLVELVGENTVHLDAELKKIALAHAGDQPVDAAEVDRLVERTAEGNIWAFLDAFAARDAAECVRIYKTLDKESPYALIAKCTSRVRELITCRALAERGEGNARGIAARLKAPDWRAKKLLSSVRSWRAEELRRALIAARDAERAMKSGADPDAAFLEWMLGALRKRA